ncbi:uncharacterized protein [Typha latifolia]|uniref:uncharacterized protein n=1 Tax=Typha latifolia TaxID=4733 RepID=UPI003C30213A
MASSNAITSPQSKSHHATSSSTTRFCLCAPTSHPGSFRCMLHRGMHRTSRRPAAAEEKEKEKEKAKAKSMRVLLMQIIRPASLDLSRRRNFQPRPSRFCLMSSTNRGGGGGQEVGVL